MKLPVPYWIMLVLATLPISIAVKWIIRLLSSLRLPPTPAAGSLADVALPVVPVTPARLGPVKASGLPHGARNWALFFLSGLIIAIVGGLAVYLLVG